MTDSQLIEAAIGGDQAAFAELVEPHRRPLHAHCYRMLGSLQDAEDAVQETLLRAWRSLSSFQGRSSLRSWLYSIATNVCLRTIERRPSRVLPIDYGPAADPHEPIASAAARVRVDRAHTPTSSSASTTASPDRRPATSSERASSSRSSPRSSCCRLGSGRCSSSATFSASPARRSPRRSRRRRPRSTAPCSARTRRSSERRPSRSQQATLRSLGDEQLKGIVQRYVDAWARNDVDTIVGMLTDTATLAMPPIPSWYHGREAIERVLRGAVFDGTRSWRMLPTAANGQLAVGAYELDSSGVYAPHGVTVLTLEGELIDEIIHFRDPSMIEWFGLPLHA